MALRGPRDNAVEDECRVPVDGRLIVNRTRDGGQTFEQLSNGLPQQHCYDLVYRYCLDIDGCGDRLVMGSATGSLWVSEIGGDDWHCTSTHLPPSTTSASHRSTCGKSYCLQNVDSRDDR